GDADLALATQPTGAFPDLVMLEYARLPRALFVPCHHPLAKEAIVGLDRIAAFPLVTLDAGSHGQARMRELFVRNGIQPNIVLGGPISEVWKAFVGAGLGTATWPGPAFEGERNSSLRALDLDPLSEPHRASIVIRRNAFLRSFAYDFIQLLAPTLDRRAV